MATAVSFPIQVLGLSDWSNDGSLPPNWEAEVDAETGQTFYIDHNTQTTSWVDPRDYFRRKASFKECEGDELPFGWEAAVDAEVGQYFIDHNTWTTQLEDPRAWGRVAQQSQELSSFLLEARVDLASQRTRTRELMAAIKAAECKLNELRTKQPQFRPDDPRGDILLKQIVDTAAHINSMQLELQQVLRQVEREQSGVGILEELSQRMGSQHEYDLEDARSAILHLQHLDGRMQEAAQERTRLEHNLLAQDLQADGQTSETEELRRRLQRLEHEQEAASNQSRLENVLYRSTVQDGLQIEVCSPPPRTYVAHAYIHAHTARTHTHTHAHARHTCTHVRMHICTHTYTVHLNASPSQRHCLEFALAGAVLAHCK